MNAASQPFSGGEPRLIIKEPFQKPRYDRQGDGHFRRPLAIRWIEQARLVLGVSMRDFFTVGSARKPRSLHKDSGPISSPIADADMILACRRQRLNASPGNEESAFNLTAETWPDLRMYAACFGKPNARALLGLPAIERVRPNRHFLRSAQRESGGREAHRTAFAESLDVFTQGLRDNASLVANLITEKPPEIVRASSRRPCDASSRAKLVVARNSLDLASWL